MHSYLNATFYDFKIPSLHSGLKIVNSVQKSWLTPLWCSSRNGGRWLHWGLLSRMGCDISSLCLCSHPRPDRPRSDSLRWSLFLLVSWPLRTQSPLKKQASVAFLSLSHFTLNRNYYRAYSVYHLVPALSKTHSMNRVQNRAWKYLIFTCF